MAPVIASLSGRPATVPLLEREAQLSAIGALVAAACGGDGRFVVLEGGAGLGKTRLLDESRLIAESMGMRVLSARAGELEGEFAYGIVRQLFEPLLATAGSRVRSELLAEAAALVEPLFAASPLDAPREAPGDASFATLHGLYWLTVNVCVRQGLFDAALSVYSDALSAARRRGDLPQIGSRRSARGSRSQRRARRARRRAVPDRLSRSCAARAGRRRGGRPGHRPGRRSARGVGKRAARLVLAGPRPSQDRNRPSGARRGGAAAGRRDHAPRRLRPAEQHPVA